MRVVATHRSAKPGEKAENIDLMYLPEQISQLLGESDYVFIMLPLTSETRKVFNEKMLRAMKPTAYLINVSRGNIIDEPALIRALEEGWIAGVGLDVFATEPLPPENRLWELPNVIYAPHVAGDFEGNYRAITELFVEYLKHFMNGREIYYGREKKMIELKQKVRELEKLSASPDSLEVADEKNEGS